MIKLVNGYLKYENKSSICCCENLIHLAYESNYRVEEMSLALGISIRHLERTFLESLAITPKEWLRQQRMVRAKHLLLSGGSSKFISYDLGFKYTQHFSREFQSYYNISPMAYKKANSASTSNPFAQQYA